VRMAVGANEMSGRRRTFESERSTAMALGFKSDHHQRRDSGLQTPGMSGCTNDPPMGRHDPCRDTLFDTRVVAE
jgi:hypothetical protein